jgi:hypothetical protein
MCIHTSAKRSQSFAGAIQTKKSPPKTPTPSYVTPTKQKRKRDLETDEFDDEKHPVLNRNNSGMSRSLTTSNVTSPATKQVFNIFSVFLNLKLIGIQQSNRTKSLVFTPVNKIMVLFTLPVPLVRSLYSIVF